MKEQKKLSREAQEKNLVRGLLEAMQEACGDPEFEKAFEAWQKERNNG